MRLRSLVLAVLLAAGSVAAPYARGQTGQDIVDRCIEQGGSPSMCRGVHALLRTIGGICRDALANDPTCTLVDGISIDEALVAAHEASWLARSLSLQRGLDDDRPLHDELWAHTHNSFNADAYGPSFYGLDRNHIYTVRDQLRMGIRAIELDLHWAESTNGDLANSLKGVVVCHGEPVDLGPTIVHFGCGLNDPRLETYLAEIRGWIDENPNEFLMVYLENNLDGDETAHDLASAAIAEALGDVTYAPDQTGACQPLPLDATRRQLRDSGKRVILTGNCGPGAWNTWVFERGPRWEEGGLDYGDDLELVYPCIAERQSNDYAHNWTRRWGDETGLSAGAETFGMGGGDVTVNDARNMIRCGVNMAGMDNLVPFDERLVAYVWSWAPDEPSSSADGMCATQGPDGRFVARDCGPGIQRVNALPFACFDGTDWHVTATRDQFLKGQKTCAAEGLGTFAVPWGGYENERLRDARPIGASAVWLNYQASGGRWIS